MSSAPIYTSFSGVRVTVQSRRSVDEVFAALLSDVGATPVKPNEVAARCNSWEAYEAEMGSRIGTSGFTLFDVIDHGAWIKKVGINQKLIRVIIGNPMIALTMIRHDLTAGLFAPVELLIVEKQGGIASVVYVQPSSLLVVDDQNSDLLAAAQELDKKLEAPAMKIAT